jgi:hypothetical protein
MYTFKLNCDKWFEDDKIKIIYLKYYDNKRLAVYIKDKDGKDYCIIKKILIDKNNESFDIATDKIRNFVRDKLQEWITEEDEKERARLEAIEREKLEEKEKIKRLMDLF